MSGRLRWIGGGAIAVLVALAGCASPEGTAEGPADTDRSASSTSAPTARVESTTTDPTTTTATSTDQSAGPDLGGLTPDDWVSIALDDPDTLADNGPVATLFDVFGTGGSLTAVGARSDAPTAARVPAVWEATGSRWEPVTDEAFDIERGGLTSGTRSGTTEVVVGYTGSGEQTKPAIWSRVADSTWQGPVAVPSQAGLGAEITAVTEGPNGWVAVGRSRIQDLDYPLVWRSDDLEIWEEVETPINTTTVEMISVASAESGYVAADLGGPRVWTSADGRNWVAQDFGGSGRSGDVASVGGRFYVTVAAVADREQSRVMSSIDLATWDQRWSSTIEEAVGVENMDGTAAIEVVRNVTHNVYREQPGGGWAPLPNAPEIAEQEVRQLEYDYRGLFAVSGDRMVVGNPTRTSQLLWEHRDDGWSPMSATLIPPLRRSNYREVAGLATNGESLVAVGVETGRDRPTGMVVSDQAGLAWYSLDGTTWVTAALPREAVALDDVTWVDALRSGPGYLAVGRVGQDGEQFGLYLWSSDGTSWEPVGAPGPQYAIFPLTTIGFKGRAIAAGAGSTEPAIVYSEDGQAWDAAIGERLDDSMEIRDLCSNADTIYAVGVAGDSPGRLPAVWSSADGVGWNKEEVPTIGLDVRPAGCAVDPDGAVVVVGSSGLGDSGDAVRWFRTTEGAWTVSYLDAPAEDPRWQLGRSVMSDRGRWIAMGTGETVDRSADPLVWTSPDGTTWSRFRAAERHGDDTGAGDALAGIGVGEALVLGGLQADAATIWMGPRNP